MDTARSAMTQAVEQARRAADVVGRLRRAVERPDATQQSQAMDLVEAVRRALSVLGVAESQMEAVSFGEEKLRNTAGTEDAHAENRRTDVVYGDE